MSSSDYFQLFELPPSFQVDEALLSQRYRELQKQFHPDRYAAESAAVQKEAMQKAADINTAYSTLRDSVLRARHLLALAGHAVNVESKTVSDTDFLMAQMELREQLEEASDFSELAALRDEVEDWQESLSREFVLDYQEQDWLEAADTVRKMQFMTRLLDEIQDAEARLEDAEYENDDEGDD